MNKTVRTNKQGVVFTTYTFPDGWRSLEDYYVSEDGYTYTWAKLEKLLDKLERFNTERSTVYITAKLVLKETRTGNVHEANDAWRNYTPDYLKTLISDYALQIVEL